MSSDRPTAGGGGAEHDRLHDDARNQIVDVADPGDVDGGAVIPGEKEHSAPARTIRIGAK
jgi:hypothetical protein